MIPFSWAPRKNEILAKNFLSSFYVRGNGKNHYELNIFKQLTALKKS